ncbi:MAG: SoxR reducing system RseC family protein [Desulfobacterales bacterium]
MGAFPSGVSPPAPRKQGEVIALEGAGARVKIRRGGECAACSCAALCSPFGRDWMVLSAENPLRAGVGDEVEISYRAAGRTRAVALLYLLPLGALLAGAVLGQASAFLRDPDLSAAVGGLTATGACFLLLRLYSRRRLESNPALRPVIVGILKTAAGDRARPAG